MSEAAERFIVLYRLERLLGRTAQAAVDGDLAEAACLLLAAQSERGMTEKEASDALLVPRERLALLLRVLENREQIFWERSRADRRMFAFRATEKGLDAAAFVDEVLAVAFINAGRSLTEEGFDRAVGLLHVCFGGGEISPDEWLVPARALGALAAFGDAWASAGAQRGVPILQGVLLALLSQAAGPMELGTLAALTAAPVPTVSLHAENLVAKGLAKYGEARTSLALEESAAARLETMLGHGELERLRSEVRAQQAAQLGDADTLDELLSLFGYVLASEEEPNTLYVGARSVTANRPSTLSALYALLSQLFSYPDRHQAEQRTSSAVLDQARALLQSLGAVEGLPVDVAARFEAQAAHPAALRAQEVRAEFTRLFCSYPRLVPLTGSHWVRRDRTAFSLDRGERAAVGLEYRKLGLKNRPGNGEPFDTLVSELDFLSYIAALEARAFEGGDAASAREWELLRADFCEHHFRELAQGVAGAVVRCSDNAALGLYAWLLDFLAEER